MIITHTTAIFSLIIIITFLIYTTQYLIQTDHFQNFVYSCKIVPVIVFCQSLQGGWIVPVPIKHGNLYNFATYPVYGRYFISPISMVWSGGIRGHYISKGGTGAHNGRTAGMAGA